MRINGEEAKRKAGIMIAFSEGAEIEYSKLGSLNWTTNESPGWNWCNYCYRIKVVPKVVKYLCYSVGEALVWVSEDQAKVRRYKKRVPSEDKEVIIVE